MPTSTVQPITSISPAAETATIPGTVPASPFSRTMAVSTGTAVMDSATPKNSTEETVISLGAPNRANRS